ncbi:MAG: class I SAM-dependent methyltransferase [Candidatus Omnitrophica bacterium]|nr:class I SAM-dependent methyltransferase [Candidatus Omnitrophota bacterium]
MDHEAQEASFQRLARLTALKQAPDGTFHLGHWRRGPFLSALVKRLRPRHILEFGTGRGYGALCMAQASVEGGFDCTVWTIDVIPTTQPQPWLLDEGAGAVHIHASLEEVWSKHVPVEWTQRIRCLTGDSRSVMRRWRREGLPRVDCCFIDGGHDYATVKHDFVAALRIANPRCSFLLDDYTERKGYGVKRFFDRELAPRLPAEAWEILDPMAWDETAFGEKVPHKMVLLKGEAFGALTLAQLYSPREVRAFDRWDAWRTDSQRLARRVKALLRLRREAARTT